MNIVVLHTTIDTTLPRSCFVCGAENTQFMSHGRWCVGSNMTDFLISSTPWDADQSYVRCDSDLASVIAVHET